MKKISIMLPTYNEEENIRPLCQEIKKVFSEKLASYEYEIIIIDNFSADKTRAAVESLCAEDKRIKAIFNAKNFGHIRSPYYGLLQSSGDCVIAMCADFQDPPEMIENFVKEWEKGHKIVIGIKKKSKENPLMYMFRSAYYRLIKRIADVDHISHFTGFGLYDRQFIKVLSELGDPMPYLRGIVAELGFERKEIEYEQQKRRFGKTKNNFFSLYDMAMLGITSYTKVVMRLATLAGFAIAGVSFLIALLYLVLKLVFWDRFPMGTAPIIISIFFLGSVQLFFIGFLGEYILNINTRVMKRPLVVEERRINF
ncbi:MAG TPA: glycosyltransferase family 2 protein [Candidatus Goldiibacteriota bacterium]|nr:glycosyltransferase family 2 protein [Candidatus Goldiibacteriota bacterium]HRQ44159.1 glycosyltransferase family 2 protein [Candidatus Goldiibacteriota bacterium]